MPSSPPDDSVKLFLSYGREDFEAVSDLYDRLEALVLRPWMDKRDLLPGQRWRKIIPRQVQQADLVLVCLSPQSVDERGFFQREIRTALDAWKDKLQADIYLIPVLLEPCEVPQELEEFNPVELYDRYGWKMLLRAIEAAAKDLGRSIPGMLMESPQGQLELIAQEPRASELAAPDTLMIPDPVYPSSDQPSTTKGEQGFVGAGERLTGQTETDDFEHPSSHQHEQATSMQSDATENPPNADEVRILQYMGKWPAELSISIYNLVVEFVMPEHRVRWHLERLRDHGFIGPVPKSNPVSSLWVITPKGVDYLMRRNLL